MKTFLLLRLSGSLYAGEWHWIDKSDVYVYGGLEIKQKNFTFLPIDWFGDGQTKLIINELGRLKMYVWHYGDRGW